MHDLGPLIAELRHVVADDAERDERAARALDIIATAFEAMTVTLHAVEDSSRTLRHVAALGLPEAVRQLTEVIPFGKGMAGICWQRGEPVTVCNLQTDDSGVVRPGARETRVAGALVVPLRVAGEVRGTLGIGKAEDHDYGADEIARLEECGATLVALLA